MPHALRAEAPGAIHHVVAKGTAGQEIVHDDIDRSALLVRLARTVELHRWSCWAYCLMDTHFHLIVETSDPNLGIGMKWVKASYAQDFNRRYNRRGHVFGGRFYSQMIERDQHLLEACIYVVLNPVRAGLVDLPEAWPWSSYRASAGLAAAPRPLDPQHFLEFLDTRRKVAERLFASTVVETFERDRNLIHQSLPALRFAETRRAGSDPTPLGV